ncbi:MAG TPA: enoyl-CoA hydratase-related protein [Novosphingobium sp.]
MQVDGLNVTRPEGHPGVLLVTLDRPPVNALSLALFKALRDLFLSVGGEPGVRCVVLTGAGRMFSAGADVKELSERTIESQLARSVVSRGCFDAIRRCEVPVIAAVNGAALGAGLVVASSCDLMVASEAATFALPEVNVGVMGGTRHSARVLPDKLVRYLALTGRRIDARTLQSYGGINEIVAPERLLDAALDLADEIARKSPMAIKLMKESINLTEDMPVIEGYRVEQLFTTLASGMEESKEAAAAFVEKRDPRWVREFKG